ncbi:MAG TPA: hypothetical protein PK759_02940 [Spirochaetales bacterium]|nr:hypothetical protein [Spirochaetales bacterium]HPS14736.1 hypothetical protein [Spirochaetales bacterium]
MRVAVVAISDRNSSKLRSIAGACVATLKAQGHDTELFFNLDPRVSYFDFVVFCSEPKGLGSSTGTLLAHQLDFASGLEGKRSAAVMVRSGLASGKALQKLMATLENQGLRIVQSQIVSNTSQVPVIMKETPIERP